MSNVLTCTEPHTTHAHSLPHPYFLSLTYFLFFSTTPILLYPNFREPQTLNSPVNRFGRLNVSAVLPRVEILEAPKPLWQPLQHCRCDGHKPPPPPVPLVAHYTTVSLFIHIIRGASSTGTSLMQAVRQSLGSFQAVDLPSHPCSQPSTHLRHTLLRWGATFCCRWRQTQWRKGRLPAAAGRLPAAISQLPAAATLSELRHHPLHTQLVQPCLLLCRQREVEPV